MYKCKLSTAKYEIHLTTIQCDKVYQLPVHGQWFSLGIPATSTNKTEVHFMTELLLKVWLNKYKLVICHVVITLQQRFLQQKCVII